MYTLFELKELIRFPKSLFTLKKWVKEIEKQTEYRFRRLLVRKSGGLRMETILVFSDDEVALFEELLNLTESEKLSLEQAVVCISEKFCLRGFEV